MGHAAVTPTHDSCGRGYLVPHTSCTPHLLRKGAAQYSWYPHGAFFRPELPRRSVAYFKRSALASLLPRVLRRCLDAAASGCGHLHMGKRAISLAAFRWKSGKPPAGKCNHCKRKEWWDNVWMGVGSSHLVSWFTEQGLFTTISTVQWWSCCFHGSDTPEPNFNSQGVAVSQVLAFLSCQVNWTHGLLVFPLLLFANGKRNFIALVWKQRLREQKESIARLRKSQELASLCRFVCMLLILE